jgi:hypothetical protein
MGAVFNREGKAEARSFVLVTREEMRLLFNSVELYFEKHKKKRGMTRLYNEMKQLNGA